MTARLVPVTLAIAACFGAARGTGLLDTAPLALSASSSSASPLADAVSVVALRPADMLAGGTVVPSLRNVGGIVARSASSALLADAKDGRPYAPPDGGARRTAQASRPPPSPFASIVHERRRSRRERRQEALAARRRARRLCHRRLCTSARVPLRARAARGARAAALALCCAGLACSTACMAGRCATVALPPIAAELAVLALSLIHI